MSYTSYLSLGHFFWPWIFANMNNAVRSVDTSPIVSLAYVASVRAHGLTDMSVWEGFPSVIYLTAWWRDFGSYLDSFARWGTVWVNKWMVKINYWTNKSNNVTFLSRTLGILLGFTHSCHKSSLHAASFASGFLSLKYHLLPFLLTWWIIQ